MLFNIQDTGPRVRLLNREVIEMPNPGILSEVFGTLKSVRTYAPGFAETVLGRKGFMGRGVKAGVWGRNAVNWGLGRDFGAWGGGKGQPFNWTRAMGVGARGAMGYAALDFLNPFSSEGMFSLFD